MVRFKDLASRITGVSIPVFGISWNPPETEREIVRQMFIILEDRRALYNDYACQIEHEVAHSALEFTAALKRLPETSEATSSFKAMRAGCPGYLDHSWQRYGMGPLSFIGHLGRLRAIISVHVAYLAVKDGIDLDAELVRVIPIELRDATYLDA
jgi:hypothetical protein